MDTRILEPYLDNVLEEAAFSDLPGHYRGKVRDNYDLPGGQRIIITSDRISAFDRNLTTIPLKGQVLTQIARFWFDTTADIVPNHVLAYPDPNVVIGEKLKILPVEVVVRDYMAGTTGTSIWPMYKSGKRDMYGITFPEGLQENLKLPQTIITPTTKAFDAGHDEPLSTKDIIEKGLLTQNQWQTVTDMALALFERGREIASERGLILVDTKYEFGFDHRGRIVLGDEIHTPDSSRYWFAETYQARLEAGQKPESFDKDFIRSWVIQRCDPYKDDIPEIPRDMRLKTAAVYIEAFERITGQKFALPDVKQPPKMRIHKAIKDYSSTIVPRPPPKKAGDGPMEVMLEKGKMYSFCTCGYSRKQPFCDGAHKEFAPDYKSYKFEAKEDGSAWLCCCKNTKDQPFCDGAHNTLNEKS